MQSTSALTKWKTYKRYSDNRQVEARLVMENGEKMMEVKQPVQATLCCPNCDALLSQQSTESFPNFRLVPKIFHEKHKPA